MFDKYEDYPNGISRHAILSASATQLSRILEIEIAEYRDAIERCLENSDELESPLNRLSNMGRLLNETLSSLNRENNSEETTVVQASIYILDPYSKGLCSSFSYALKKISASRIGGFGRIRKKRTSKQFGIALAACSPNLLTRKSFPATSEKA